MIFGEIDQSTIGCFIDFAFRIMALSKVAMGRFFYESPAQDMMRHSLNQ